MSDLYTKNAGQLIPRQELSVNPGFLSSSQVVLEARFDVVAGLAQGLYIPNAQGKLIKTNPSFAVGEMPSLWTNTVADHAVLGRGAQQARLTATALSNDVPTGSTLAVGLIRIIEVEGAEKIIKLSSLVMVAESLTFVSPIGAKKLVSATTPHFKLLTGVTYCLGVEIGFAIPEPKSRVIIEANLSLDYTG